MELSELPRKELQSLKVGDVVIVQIGFSDEVLPPKAIIAVEPQWGTGALPVLTLEGHNPNWLGVGSEMPRHTECLQFNAYWVREIVSRAKYVVSPLRAPRNVIAEYVTGRLADAEDGYRNYPRRDAPKGQLCGRYRRMREPFAFALAKLPYEIITSLHKERAIMLWKQAGCPGLVRSPDSILEDSDRHGRRSLDLPPLNDNYCVREKPFCRFVRQNWSKLVMTKAEMDKQEDDCRKWEQESMLRDMEDERAFQEANEPDYENDNGGWPVDWADSNDDDRSERYQMTAD